MITPVAELAATRGRILGVDFGDRRTGLAISDVSRFLAGGIGTVSPGGIAATVKAVAEIAAEQGAVAAVVGLPRNMDGTEGSRAERCREFALMLADEAGIPVAIPERNRHARQKKKGRHRHPLGGNNPAEYAGQIKKSVSRDTYNSQSATPAT